MDAAMAQQKDRPTETSNRGPLSAEPTGPQLGAAASTFALLSNSARLHVLWLAAQDSHDVTALAERTGLGVATMSQHLTKLRLAGLISARREGRRHIYTVDAPRVRRLAPQISAHSPPDGALPPPPPLNG